MVEAFLQLVFCADLAEDEDSTEKLAVAAADRGGAVGDEDLLAIAGDEDDFGREFGSRLFQQVGNRVGESLPRVRFEEMKDLGHRPAAGFLDAVAADRLGDWVHPGDQSLRVGGEYGLADRVQGDPEVGLALTESLFGHLERVDVGVGADHAQRFSGGITADDFADREDPFPRAVGAALAEFDPVDREFAGEVIGQDLVTFLPVFGVQAFLPFRRGLEKLGRVEAEHAGVIVGSGGFTADEIEVIEADPAAFEGEAKAFFAEGEGGIGGEFFLQLIPRLGEAELQLAGEVIKGLGQGLELAVALDRQALDLTGV